MIQYTDIELIQGCQENNNTLQRALYDKYKDAMYTICKRMINDDDMACDALQEGFVEVFRSISSFRAESTLGAWIKTIIIRRALLIAKRFKSEEELEIIADVKTIDWDSNMTGKELNKAISNLPTGYRNVFLLIEVEGYTHKETGRLLGISEGTSKSQLFNSKKILQRALAELRN